MDPSKFRPISISSVILRHFHKILANRLMALPLLDEKQRGFIEADGIAENVFVLSSMIADAREKLKELHIAAIDVRKAFDTVSHEAIVKELAEKRIPKKFVDYIQKLYEVSTTVLEVDGEISSPIHPGQGVRQGDPLSSIIFNIVMDGPLRRIPSYIGYKLNDCNVNGLAFADDVVLSAGSKEGLQQVIDGLVMDLAKQGLSPMPAKCLALSLVPSGKDKKIKTVTTKTFKIADSYISQIGVLDTWKHLGVNFSNRGPTSPKIEIEEKLQRISSAPLKPQQRMAILKIFLIPRYQHSLIFGNVRHADLRRLDATVRRYVRSWLSLPKDIPIAFVHATVSAGGLGVMSFASKVPELTRKRLENLRSSLFSAARSLWGHSCVISKLRWCQSAKVNERDWARKLYSSVDGWELRESGKSSLSTSWLNDPFVSIPAREYIQNIRVKINALPSRMRTTRGRRDTRPVLCRAACGEEETTAHIVQRCCRTHGGRVLRHDAIAKKVTQLLRNKRFTVEQEVIYQTREGPRKPDIVAASETGVSILDVQIVSGSRPLDELHRNKTLKYLNNTDLVSSVAGKFRVPAGSVRVSSVTISWRGVWAPSSESFLRSLGLSKMSLKGLTTRVLQGSHINFNRFNCMTSVASHGRWPWRPRREQH